MKRLRPLLRAWQAKALVSCPNGCGEPWVVLRFGSTDHFAESRCPDCKSHLGWLPWPEIPLDVAQEHLSVSPKSSRKRSRTLGVEHGSPFCELCLSVGYDANPLEIHHIIPKDGGGDDEPDNLMTLCHSCHELVEWRRREAARS